MSLYQVAAPDFSSLARGGATLLLLEGLNFSADGKFLLVRGTFTDDADAVASTLHTGVWLYDVANQQYAACLNALAVSAGVVPSDLEISKAVISGKQSAVYIAAEVVLRDNPSVTRLAYFQQTTLQQADILSSIVQDAALPAVQRMALSHDGRFLALQTDSAVLTPATSIDTDEVSDIYLLDLLTKKVELVTQVAGSEVSQAAYLGNVYTDKGIVKISFSSEGYFKATDQNSKLSDNSAAARTDAYVWSSAYDLSGLSGTPAFDLVSLNTLGQAAGFVNPDQSLQVTQTGTYFNTTASDSVSTGHSANQFVTASDSGRFVAVLTTAPTGYAASEALQLQVTDATLAKTNVISLDTAGNLADEGVISATLSPHASLVAFTSTASNLGNASASTLGGNLFIATTGFHNGYDIQANVAFWKAGASGQRPNLAGVNLTQASETGTSTAQSGITLYGVEDTQGEDDGFMTLSPQASSPSNAKAAITLTDVLAALKVFLGKSLPDSYASPLNYIAADFDANGTVNLTDVLSLLKYFLGKVTTPAPSWVFVDAADFSSDGKSLAGANSASINKTDTTPHAIDQSFDNGQESIQLIGVLRGDVDGSWLSP